MTFFSLIKSFRKGILVSLVCVLFYNFLSLSLPWGIKIIIDEVLINHDVRLLHGIIFCLIVIVFLRALFGVLRKYMASSLGEQIVCSLREKIFWHIEKMSLASIYKITPTQILSRITSDVDSIRRFLMRGIIDSVYAIVNVILIIIILLYLDIKMTLVSLSFLPFFALIYFRMLPQLKKGHMDLREEYGRLILRINEVLSGFRMVRAFSALNYEKECFTERQNKILKTAIKTHNLDAWLWTGIEFFSSLGVISVLWIGGRQVIFNKITTGELVAFYSYLGMLFSPVIQMVVINSSYQEAKASLDHINKVLVVDDEVPERPGAKKLLTLKGKIEFSNVSFSYSKDNRVLNNVSFFIRPGEKVGIVGPTGAGKTTIVNILLRFIDPDIGNVYIDGYCLRDLSLDMYRKNLGVVLQDDYIMSGTIEDNIRYGSYNASQPDVIKAAKDAHIHNFILSLPDGYNTHIGEQGLTLSSGQRQRIAIARALIKNPSIIILDEATSSLDALTENSIQKTIKEVYKNKTVIMIAHRFSTIIEADQIVVLDKGELVERGPHDYLLKKNGFYSNLYMEQFKT